MEAPRLQAVKNGSFSQMSIYGPKKTALFHDLAKKRRFFRKMTKTRQMCHIWTLLAEIGFMLPDKTALFWHQKRQFRVGFRQKGSNTILYGFPRSRLGRSKGSLFDGFSIDFLTIFEVTFWSVKVVTF